MAKRTDTPPIETVPKPKEVKKPDEPVTVKEVQEAVAVVETAERKVETTPEGPIKDKFLETMEQMKGTLNAILEKVSKEDEPVPVENLTPTERTTIATTRDPEQRSRLHRALTWLDSLFSGGSIGDTSGSERIESTDNPEA